MRSVVPMVVAAAAEEPLSLLPPPLPNAPAKGRTSRPGDGTAAAAVVEDDDPDEDPSVEKLPLRLEGQGGRESR